ncbi:MAG: hypothetical protein KDD45_16900 [Bdellovibrionales bacterium]|nr:hypothetical protein [Bdellovibrionales bacterium]
MTDRSNLGMFPQIIMAEFHHDIDKLSFFDNFKKFDGVVMVELGEYIDLIIDDLGYDFAL